MCSCLYFGQEARVGWSGVAPARLRFFAVSPGAPEEWAADGWGHPVACTAASLLAGTSVCHADAAQHNLQRDGKDRPLAAA